MSEQADQSGGYEARSGARLTLRARAGTYAAGHLDDLLARAERVARYVDARLNPLARSGRRFERLTLTLDDGPPESPAALPSRAARLRFTADSPPRELDDGVALLLVLDRLGGPEVWQPRPGRPDGAAIDHLLRFLATGLARHLATCAAWEGRQAAFAAPLHGGPPRQSADQVCRQVVADRDGKVPLYEAMLRGPGLAGSPPEYLALAESFCGYLFERDGPKAYQRLVRVSHDNPNFAADLVYGKSLEELQDEWLRTILGGPGRRPVSLKAFARQVAPYLRPYTWLIVLALMLMFLGAGVAQVAPFTIRDIIDILNAGVAKGDPQIVPDFWQTIGRALSGEPAFDAFATRHATALDTLAALYTKILILTVAVFVNLCAIIWLIYIVNVVGQNIMRDLRLQFAERLHGLSAGFYARHRMGDMLSRFTSDIARLADPLTEAVAYSIYHLIFLAATVAGMLAMSWQLSVVLAIIIPIYVVINRRFGPTMQGAARIRQERLAQLNAEMTEMLYGHGVIKSYGIGRHLMRYFGPKVNEYRKVAIWTDFLRAVYNEVIGIAENVQTKLVLLVGGTLVVFGGMTTGTIVGFSTLAGRFLSPLHKLGLIYAGVAIASASLHRVEEILREPMEAMDTPPGGAFAPRLDEAIVFENVCFSYTGTEPTLADVSLRIPAGCKMAFVGPTGAGKSTLVSLIPRFYDVDRGRVEIDGQDIRSFSLTGLRQAISIVSQDTFIFNSTIMENIRLGRLDAADEEVIEAARAARLHDFVETLPAGYDTLAGERGARLSGGQRQRLAIARALLRNSPILILDEATSALDAETESEILAELDEVTRGKTVISITHRLGLALKAEVICVLQAGRIVQQGTHEQLMQKSGLYRKLFEDQNEELLRRGVLSTPEAAGSTPSFSMVTAEEVASLAHLLKVERHPAGAVFGGPNGTSGGLYLLRSGQVELTVNDERGAEQRLFVGAPAVDGERPEMSLLLNVPSSAWTRAVTDVEVLVMRGDDLHRLLEPAWSVSPEAGGKTPGGMDPVLCRAVLDRWGVQRILAPPATPTS